MLGTTEGRRFLAPSGSQTHHQSSSSLTHLQHPFPYPPYLWPGSPTLSSTTGPLATPTSATAGRLSAFDFQANGEGESRFTLFLFLFIFSFNFKYFLSYLISWFRRFEFRSWQRVRCASHALADGSPLDKVKPIESKEVPMGTVCALKCDALNFVHLRSNLLRIYVRRDWQTSVCQKQMWFKIQIITYYGTFHFRCQISSTYHI